MRIGIDIRPLIEEVPSGVTEYTRQLLGNLLRIDKENTYLLFYNALKPLSEKYQTEFNQKNVELKSFRYPNKIFNTTLVLFNQPKIDKLLGGVDVIFSPNINFLSLSGGCKHIITIHDLSFDLYSNFYSMKGRIWHGIVRPKKLVEKSDKVIAVSENTKKDLIDRYKLRPDKIKVIYSGIDFDFFHEIDENKKEEIRKKYNLDKPFILTLGNIEPRKNIQGLIEAFNNLKDKYNLEHQLVFIGAGNQRYLNYLRRSLPYSSDILFTGYISSEEKAYLYRLSSLFVYPSFYEGFGFPPLEAMACGVPVICSNSSSLPEIVGNAGLLVDGYNINELTESIFQMLTNNGLRDNFIKRGLERAKFFSWRKTAQDTLQLFNSI